MNIMNSVKGLFTNSESNVWFARAVGILLAAISIVAINFAGFPFSPYLLLMWACVLAVIAIAFFWKGKSGVTAVRWWARIVGVVMGVLLATIVIGEGMGGHGPPITTLSVLAEFVPWILVFVGIVIMFFWEGIGGAMTALGGLIEQGNVILVAHGGLNPFILVFVFVGLASVYCWWRTHRLSLIQQPA